MKRDVEERSYWLLQKAWWAAMSGRFGNWREVEAALLEQEQYEVEERLADPYVRKRMDEVCGKSQQMLVAPPISNAAGEEAAIWRVLDAEHAAIWMRNLPAFTASHAGTSFERWWAWIRFSGLARHDGWAVLEDRARQDMLMDPDACPYLAYGARREKVNLRIGTDMAWVSFEMVYPSADLPGFSGPGRGNELRILEKFDGEWKVVFFGALDEQFGQTDVPTWEIDRDGRVLNQNPAAGRHLGGETELAVRNGMLQMRDAETNRRLSEIIGWTATRPQGFMAAYAATPLVFDPGNDLPARVWWVRTESGKLFVSFNDPQLAEQRLLNAARAYGLSPSQQRLVVSLVAGQPLTDAAKSAGVRISTARTQLQRIFDKLGVRTQPSLVNLLLSVDEPE